MIEEGSASFQPVPAPVDKMTRYIYLFVSFARNYRLLLVRSRNIPAAPKRPHPPPLPHSLSVGGAFFHPISSRFTKALDSYRALGPALTPAARLLSSGFPEGRTKTHHPFLLGGARPTVHAEAVFSRLTSVSTASCGRLFGATPIATMDTTPSRQPILQSQRLNHYPDTRECNAKPEP